MSGFALSTYSNSFLGFNSLYRNFYLTSFCTNMSKYFSKFTSIFSANRNVSRSQSCNCGLDTVNFSQGSMAYANNVVKINNPSANPNQAKYDEIWNSIDAEERKLVEGIDLTETNKKGKPIYQVALAKDGNYHIYKNGKAVKKVKTGSNKLSKVKTNTIAEAGGKNDTYVLSQMLAGSYRNPCSSGAGVIGQSVVIQDYEPGRQFYLSEGGKTASPLVIDYNQDGKVDAKAGVGIDIDGDGKVDGAASNGDKMLAMSDSNGNGSIDGTEVFGDKTINPFTGQKINASNGFEALKQVALSAQSATGISCFDGTNVNLNNLKSALATKGVNLGFVSGNNNTSLENLSKINKINVVDYKNTQQLGAVQHNQQGSGTANNGSNMKVDDVWFYV